MATGGAEVDSAKKELVRGVGKVEEELGKVLAGGIEAWWVVAGGFARGPKAVLSSS